ncbi:MAG: hypothetical protein PHY47_00780 [Lachnospiraceae bacterium]|nr:hypothetical protein [Lachnospiraceae bacterium]
MELNLRKARKLEAKIQQHLDSTRVETNAIIRVLGTLEEAQAAVKKVREESLAKLPEREQLLRLRYQIRRDIEVQNEAIGINKLINEKVLLSALSRAEIVTHAGPEGLEFEDQFNTQKMLYSSPVDSYGRAKSTTYNSHVFTQEDVDAASAKKLEYKRQIEAIEDKLGELNIIGKVKLSDDSVKLLQSVGLL